MVSGLPSILIRSLRTSIRFGKMEMLPGKFGAEEFYPAVGRNSPIVRSWDAETFFRFGEVYAPTKRIIQIPRP